MAKPIPSDTSAQIIDQINDAKRALDYADKMVNSFSEEWMDYYSLNGYRMNSEIGRKIKKMILLYYRKQKKLQQARLNDLLGEKTNEKNG